MPKPAQQQPERRDRPACAKGFVITLSQEGNLLIVADRCCRWSCLYCRLIELGKRTEHLLTQPGIAFLRYGNPELARRARRNNGGYTRIWQPGQSEPLVLASPSLFPYQPVISPDKALGQLALSVIEYGISRLVFNRTWQYEREPTHTFITSSIESKRRIDQAIEDAGYHGRRTNEEDVDVIRRKISYRLQEVIWEDYEETP